MENEIGRHDWPSLQGVAGDARALGPALHALLGADGREAALDAARRVERVIDGQGLLCEASEAVASCLVHGLWSRSQHNEDLILGILSDISAGTVDDTDPECYGPVSVDRCMSEICRGFPAYVEILENGVKSESRRACIDLILMCGLRCEEMRERALHHLRSVLRLDGIEDFQALLQASLKELEGGV
ncbi:hypothetical protein [Allostreptomyces psammosilenae]|uniref:Uncharacterized protein n=1 Tax=Allostreptomyces psammosilenae TaxID=1892865 RepID=A0A853A8B2_9ACTN|nr:hypothetical protein [Allostreptomyces psammosilenae]NYI06672.1 hypothetical protein [Allostreptomyces psammosilenae]